MVKGRTATAGAAIYYTLDASSPGIGSLLYSSPIHLNASGWIRATALKAGLNPPNAVEYYYNIQSTVATPPPAPVITPNGGTFSNCPDVSMSTSVATATIRYTLDGTLPLADSLAFSQPIHLPGSVVVSARVFANGIGGSVSKAVFVTECSQFLPRRIGRSPGRPGGED